MSAPLITQSIAFAVVVLALLLSTLHARTLNRRLDNHQRIYFSLQRECDQRIRKMQSEMSIARHNAAQALEETVLEHERELEEARLSQIETTRQDLVLVESMAGKLNLASSAMHAVQQYAEARRAKDLARSGHQLAIRLRKAQSHAAVQPVEEAA